VINIPSLCLKTGIREHIPAGHGLQSRGQRKWSIPTTLERNFALSEMMGLRAATWKQLRSGETRLTGSR
jgi:hypothetical protein